MKDIKFVEVNNRTLTHDLLDVCANDARKLLQSLTQLNNFGHFNEQQTALVAAAHEFTMVLSDELSTLKEEVNNAR